MSLWFLLHIFYCSHVLCILFYLLGLLTDCLHSGFCTKPQLYRWSTAGSHWILCFSDHSCCCQVDCAHDLYLSFIGFAVHCASLLWKILCVCNLISSFHAAFGLHGIGPPCPFWGFCWEHVRSMRWEDVFHRCGSHQESSTAHDVQAIYIISNIRQS